MLCALVYARRRLSSLNALVNSLLEIEIRKVVDPLLLLLLLLGLKLLLELLLLPLVLLPLLLLLYRRRHCHLCHEIVGELIAAKLPKLLVEPSVRLLTPEFRLRYVLAAASFILE